MVPSGFTIAPPPMWFAMLLVSACTCPPLTASLLPGAMVPSATLDTRRAPAVPGVAAHAHLVAIAVARHCDETRGLVLSHESHVAVDDLVPDIRDVAFDRGNAPIDFGHLRFQAVDALVGGVQLAPVDGVGA